jgi:hypothetical protein
MTTKYSGPNVADTGEERNKRIEMYNLEEYNLIYHLKQLKLIVPDGEKA